MKHNYHPVSTVFSEQCCHVVPLFQRPYVWTEDAQWRPLWEDISRVVGDVLNLTASNGRAQAPIQPHFLGSVVLEQLRTESGHVTRREIVDGQQRLTTLQLLLKAAHDAAAAIGATIYAGQFHDMIWNRFVPPADVNGKFKIWPTDADQMAFSIVMQAADGETPAAFNKHPFAGAYWFFRNRIGGWFGDDRDQAASRADALSIALRQHIRLMVLDIEPGEDAQIIFETLNARGTPLLPLDLVKNWLLREAARQNAGARDLYLSHWRSTFDLEIDYWREEVGRGHAQKPRADLFLQNFLALRLRDEIAVGHLYQRFLVYVHGSAQEDIASRFATLNHSAAIFRKIDEPDEGTPVGRRIFRFKTLDVVTVYPFLMVLLPRVDAPACLEILELVESYLIRRIVCGLSTRGYGRFFIGLAAEVMDSVANDEIRVVVVRYLMKSDAEAARWPSDTEFRHAWLGLEAYTKLARSTTRFILAAIEEKMRTADGLGEPFAMPPKLEIEHVMPQQWTPNWPLQAAEDRAAASERRDHLIHTFGNLTLVTSQLNKHLSNAPWASADGAISPKRETLKQRSVTKLRDGIIFPEDADWTEARIEKRNEMLFSDWALRIWPRAFQEG